MPLSDRVSRNLGEQLLHPSEVFPVGNEDCVAGAHNDEVLDTKGRHDAGVRVNHAVGGIPRHEQALSHVAGGVRLVVACKRKPRTDVVPIECAD